MCGSEPRIPTGLRWALEPIEILGFTDLRSKDEEFDWIFLGKVDRVGLPLSRPDRIQSIKEQ